MTLGQVNFTLMWNNVEIDSFAFLINLKFCEIFKMYDIATGFFFNFQARMLGRGKNWPKK